MVLFFWWWWWCCRATADAADATDAQVLPLCLGFIVVAVCGAVVVLW